MTRSAVASKSRFQPTLPARGATSSTQYSKPCFWYFNPRSPHGERRHQAAENQQDGNISTHAPRTGSDAGKSRAARRRRNFNPRSPHGERQRGKYITIGVHRFQPTLPARGATLVITRLMPYSVISTHAPRTGSDIATFVSGSIATNFNPRSPHGERRRPAPGAENRQCISTHAPRTGSDVVGV